MDINGYEYDVVTDDPELARRLREEDVRLHDSSALGCYAAEHFHLRPKGWPEHGDVPPIVLIMPDGYPDGVLIWDIYDPDEEQGEEDDDENVWEGVVATRRVDE